MTLGSLRKKRKELKNDQLENFLHSVFIMIFKVFFLDIYRFYTSISFQWYQEHPNQSSDDKVMTLRSWSKNRGLSNVAMLRTNVVTLQRAAETQHPNVATLLHDVATFGVDFGSIFSSF